MKLPEAIKEWLPKALIAGTVGSLTYFATKTVESASAPFWQHVAPAIPQTLLLSLCCFLLLVAAILAAWVVYLHRSHREPTPEAKSKVFHGQFVFVPALGLWTHQSKPGYFCPNCKSKEQESPMADHERGWKCPVKECHHLVLDTERKPPPQPPQQPRIKSWTMQW